MLPDRLLRREWALLSLILGFFLAICLVAYRSYVPPVSDLEPIAPAASLQIVVTGAVAEPGVYTCRPGCNVKTLLAPLSLLPTAHRKQIPYKKVLYHSQAIDIPEKEEKKPEK